ncbi:rhomboid family intramembrane serine protease, partial [Campylobacter concisus]|uniref:rhomboid family intramembrane serine protease n=1 Tax=Campylobacter concisus TaxID=199 RepID=UPI00112FBD10
VLMQLPGFEFLQLAGPLWPPEHPRYQHWQWLSHMFSHPTLTHLLFNMVVLCSFAPMLLLRFAPRRFLLLYLLCGLAGALLYTGWNEYLIANGVRNVAEQIGLDEATVRSALLSGGLPNVPDGLAMAFYTHLLGASGAVFGVLAAFALCFP